MLFSGSRIILMIGDDGIVVVPFGINEAPFYVPSENKQGPQEILAFLAQHKQARITLFADNLAQDYRADTMPRLNVFDRARLAQRRLKQTFPSARLTATLRMKKSPGRALMIGLHESNPVFAWAERLRARLPVIALLPVEGARLAARLMPEAAHGWAMMISRQKSGGFRQIVTYKNDLVFTRLTPLPPANSKECGPIIARDIKASLDYLSRHGLRDPRDLSVLLLTADDREAPAGLPLRNLRTLSPHDAARRLSLPFAPHEDDGTSDLIFAARLIASRGPALPLMLPEMKEISQTQSLRRWGMRAACACLIAALISTGWRAGDLADTLVQTEKETAQLVETKHALSRLQATASPVTEPLGRMRQALERRHIYEQKTPTPWRGLNELAGGLNADVKIGRLDWKKDGDAAPENFALSLRVASTGDRAETVAAFARATQDIARAMPDYEVAIVKPPYPALPQEAVSAEATQAQDDPAGEISLRRKMP